MGKERIFSLSRIEKMMYDIWNDSEMWGLFYILKAPGTSTVFSFFFCKTELPVKMQKMLEG